MAADSIAINFSVTNADGSTHTLVGIYYIADSNEPAPFALFLHGIPGSEKNHDLAHALRSVGWHVLVLHFSGTWGSEGQYSIADHPRDAIAAIDYALSDAAPVHINPDAIVVLGYSMGSRAALLAAAQDQRIKKVISVSGIADFSETLIGSTFLEPLTPYLAGSTGDSLAQQFKDAGKGLQPYETIAQIAPRPVLVVHGTDDEIVPFYNAGAFAGENVQQIAVEGANHTFGNHRHLLVDAVTQFLDP